MTESVPATVSRPFRWLHTGPARAISLLAALVLMGLVTLLPSALTGDDGKPLDHTLLSLIMLGLSGGFVHGVGFVPRHPVPRWLFSPLLIWPLLTFGLAHYAARFIQ